MRQNKKHQALSESNRRLFRRAAALILVGALFAGAAAGAYASTGSDPLQVVDNFSNFIYSLIRAIGLILIAFGIVQVGLSLKSHDPSQRANGIMTIAGGIVVTFTKEILLLITGG